MVNISQVEKILKQYFKISGKVSIGPDLVVDVQGDVRLKRNINQLPVQFGHVSGSFYCVSHRLTSLQGAPHHVGTHFSCINNMLTSLQGAPGHVGGNFDCQHNKLTSLQGAPAHVGGDFDCSYNTLTSNMLTSLEGAPDHVGGDFLCTYGAHIPLLRLIMYDRVIFWEAPEQVAEIIDKYAGEDKPGALKAAAELVRAGYKDNARW
jgi:hypothetical protein